MTLSWKRLIRFLAADDRILRGEPILPSENFDVGLASNEDRLEAKVIQGTDLYDTTGKTRVTDEVVKVKQLLGPLAPEDVPILRCVGLNYAKHSRYNHISQHLTLLISRCEQSRKQVDHHHLSPSSSSNLIRLYSATERTLLYPRSVKMIKQIMKGNWYLFQMG